MSKIECRAAVLYKEGERVKIETITVDAPKADEVRIKLVAVGVCASDAHYPWGEMKISDVMPAERSLPIVLGHEGGGIVEAVGANVTDLQVGDKVLTSVSTECGQCHTCRNTPFNICEKMNLFSAGVAETAKKLPDGTQVNSFTGIGAYSEYACVHRTQLFKVDQSIDLTEACILSCSVCTGFFAAVSQAKVSPDSTCAVWGLGGIGLNAITGCKFSGAKNIVGVDLNEEKRAIALEMGCTEFINAKTLGRPVPEYLLEKYRGADFAFDCLGNQKVIDTALASLAQNGTMVLVGLTPAGTVVNYPVLELLLGRRIVGGILGSKKTKQAFQQLTEMYMKGELNLKRLISHRFHLDQINDAFDILKQGKCIRSVIEF